MILGSTGKQSCQFQVVAFKHLLRETAGIPGEVWKCDRGIVFSVSQHQLASSSVVALRGCGHQGVKHQGFILGCEASAEAERIVEAPSKSASLHNAFMLLHALIQI